MIFTMRTLSTLKFAGFVGTTSMHASAMSGASSSSYPSCLLLMLPRRRSAT
jgi:hypothetical protein